MHSTKSKAIHARIPHPMHQQKYYSELKNTHCFIAINFLSLTFKVNGKLNIQRVYGIRANPVIRHSLGFSDTNDKLVVFYLFSSTRRRKFL